MRPAVFLDRDDTLIPCRSVTADGDLGDPALVRLNPGVAQGCQTLKDAGYALVVVSNQGGVARGKYNTEAVDRVNARLNQLLGGSIDLFQYCPYHPQGVVDEFAREHPSRKPAPGMILDAASKLNLDLTRSWMVGDSVRDCQAGRAAGCRTIQLCGEGRPNAVLENGRDQAVDFEVKGFKEAVRIIVGANNEFEGSVRTPRRVLVVAPTWVGDVAMATPAFRVLRDRLAGSLIGALVKPGIDDVLAGSDFFDELHVDTRAGVMGVKRAAGKVRPNRYDTAILFTNSFSTALIARLAGIRERIGYGRDGRGILLTQSLLSPRRIDTPPYSASTVSKRTWAPMPACEHYLKLVQWFLDDDSIPLGPMTIGISPAQQAAGAEVLQHAQVGADRPIALLNPGGNNPAKRWPADRFARLAHWLEVERGFSVVISGSPGERALAEEIAREASLGIERALPTLGLTLGSLKVVLRRASLVVTNDTGPRHLAAALKTPVITLFGPTDPRRTTIPFDREAIVVADPTLPAREVAEDFPERCRIDRIEIECVQQAVEDVLEEINR